MGSDVEGFAVQAAFLRLGDKHLSSLAFARSGVDYVLDHADDLDVSFRMHGDESYMPSNRAVSGKVVLGEPPIDDADTSRFPYIARIKVPACQQGDSHCWEEARRDEIHLRMRVFGIFGNVPFHKHAVAPGDVSQHGRAG